MAPDNEMNPVVGIDLGTTFSGIARWKDDHPQIYRLHGGGETLPSIVYIQESGVPLVGDFARPYLIIDPPNAVSHIKRHMGEDDYTVKLRGKEYTPVDISAMILERLKEDVEKRFPEGAGFELAGAVVTHPHYFKFPQIARTEEAAKQADLPVLRLLSEPVAAALDYGFETYGGLDEERNEKILVFDLGGGTFDVTVIEVTNELNSLTLKVLAVRGDDMLGGTNFDDAFVEWALAEGKIDFGSVDELTRLRTMATLLEKAIKSKEALSFCETDFLAVPNILPGQHLDLDVSREMFTELIEPYCKRIRGIVSNTLAAARLRTGELDRTIMIGGSSRIPIMRQIVQDETGAEPWANADPDLSVCLGAALLAAWTEGRVEGLDKEIVIEEATSHALGVRAQDDQFAVLIPRDRAAPVHAARMFTVRGNSVTVTPYQGYGQKVTDDSVIKLKDIPITGIQLDGNGQADVTITFKVNEEQILFVTVEAPGVYEERQMEY